MAHLSTPGESNLCSSDRGYGCSILEVGMYGELRDGVFPEILQASANPERAAKLGAMLCTHCPVRKIVEEFFDGTINLGPL